MWALTGEQAQELPRIGAGISPNFRAPEVTVNPIAFPFSHSNRSKKLRNLIFILVVTMFASSNLIADAKVPTKAIKKAGRTTTAVRVNTLLNGIGAPSAKLGNEGDFYIDTVGMNIYGPKKKALGHYQKV